MGLGTKKRQQQTADICKQHLREKYRDQRALVEEFIVEIEGNRLVKHRVDGPDGGSGYCGRNFPLIQRCTVYRSERTKLGY